MTDANLNFVQELQDLTSQVPDLVQPLVVAAAATVPFIEGEVASSIGVVAGLHPVTAAVAGVLGNLLSVALLVLAGGRVRELLSARFSAEGTPASSRRARFHRVFERYGVPGVSLLGPALMPTQFTAVALVGLGVRQGQVLLWQAVAIIGWTVAVTLVATGVLTVL